MQVANIYILYICIYRVFLANRAFCRWQRGAALIVEENFCVRKFGRFRCEKRISHFTVSFISHGKRTINMRRLIRIYDHIFSQTHSVLTIYAVFFVSNRNYGWLETLCVYRMLKEENANILFFGKFFYNVSFLVVVFHVLKILVIDGYQAQHNLNLSVHINCIEIIYICTIHICVYMYK